MDNVRVSVRLPVFGGELVTLVRNHEEVQLVKPIFNVWVDELTNQGAVVLVNGEETWVWLENEDVELNDPADASNYVAWEKTSDPETSADALIQLDNAMSGLVVLMGMDPPLGAGARQ